MESSWCSWQLALRTKQQDWELNGSGNLLKRQDGQLWFRACIEKGHVHDKALDLMSDSFISEEMAVFNHKDIPLFHLSFSFSCKIEITLAWVVC